MEAADSVSFAPSRRTIARLPIPMACALLALLAGILSGIADINQPLSFGHDLLPSYVAGRILITGDASHLYDPATAERIGGGVMRDANLTGNAHDIRWLNPPFFALLFAPLAALPYRIALLSWMTLNGALLGAALSRLLRQKSAACGFANQSALEVKSARTRLSATAIVAAILTSCPFLLAFEHQQNTFLSLAILSIAVIFWQGDRAFSAGLFVGLMAFKPQLGIAIGIALAISQGRRAIAGMLLSAAALILVGEIFVPGGTLAFVREVPPVVQAIQSQPQFNWGRHVTPTSFWCALLGREQVAIGRMLGLIISILALACVAAAAWRARGKGRPATDRLIRLTFLFLPLTAIYYMDYDLLLLAIPLVLAAREKKPLQLLAVAGPLWLAFYLSLTAVNVAHVNIAVIAIAVSGAGALTGGFSARKPKIAGEGTGSTAFATVAPSTT